MEGRRPVPADVKRQLRQEAGFGCCVCGHPFFEYHHIQPYNEGKGHLVEDMMVLCPNHHHEATIGALPEFEQRKRKAEPVNISRGYVDGLLSIADPVIAVELGSNQFIGVGFKLVVDGEPLLQLEKDDGGRLLVSLDAYDEGENLLFTLAKNDWITGDPLPWDFEFGHRWLTVRHRMRKIALHIDARRTPLLVRADLWRRSQNFSTTPVGLEFNGVAKGIGFIDLGLVAMMLVADTRTKKFTIAPEPALGRGVIVSEEDPVKRLVKGIESYNSLAEESRRLMQAGDGGSSI